MLFIFFFCHCEEPCTHGDAAILTTQCGYVHLLSSHISTLRLSPRGRPASGWPRSRVLSLAM